MVQNQLREEDFWEAIEEINNWMEKYSNGVPYCLNCFRMNDDPYVKMNLRFASISNDHFHIDIQYKCPVCRFHMAFGLPLGETVEKSKKNYQRFEEIFQGHRFDAVKSHEEYDLQKKGDKQNEKVKERLKTLGYL